MKRNITKIIDSFNSEAEEQTHRYYSFDLCYSHFRSSKETGNIDIEKSCQVLWSYLASWGMLRGSSFLLKKNPTYLRDLVEWIYQQPISNWEMDIEHYDIEAQTILNLYAQVKEHLLKGQKHQAVTLTTKVLLGVFAITPAYDCFFKQTFSGIAGDLCGFSIPNKKSLAIIYQFYMENKEEIDKLSEERKVIDFNGKITKYHYSKVKIVDMYGFRFSQE